MFNHFAERLEIVADNWPQDSLSAVAEPDSAPHHQRLHRHYTHAANAALTLVNQQTTDSRVQQLANYPGVGHGMQVIARYYEHAIAAAASQDVPYTHTMGYLATDSGFAPLREIAATNNDVAKTAEGILCIGQDSVSTLEAPLEVVYQWRHGRLVHPSLMPTLISKKLELSAFDDPHQCHAEKSHQLQRIANALLVICQRDPHLAIETYTMHQTTEVRSEKTPLA